jgi:hypothetical protein
MMTTRSSDPSLVASTDPKVLARGSESARKKKLVLGEPDEELDQVIKEVLGQAMEAGHSTSRVTAHYLLSERIGRLEAHSTAP